MNSNNWVHFTIRGVGTIAAVGSGDGQARELPQAVSQKRERGRESAGPIFSHYCLSLTGRGPKPKALSGRSNCSPPPHVTPHSCNRKSRILRISTRMLRRSSLTHLQKGQRRNSRTAV
jgi:hypothetical protein